MRRQRLAGRVRGSAPRPRRAARAGAVPARLALLLLLSSLLLLVPTGPAAARTVLTPEEALALGEEAVGRTLPELELRDVDGRPVRLVELRGRPLLVSFVYTACSTVCPALIQNLHPAVEAAQEALGRDSFGVVTVGFDTRYDTPARMRSFARGQGVELPNWRFLSADQATVDALARTLGFVYWPAAGGFDHMALVSVVDRDGRVYRQVYGGVFTAPQIVEPLKDLVLGRSRPLASLDALVDRVRWFCTVYDPRTDRYRFSYAFFIGIVVGGGMLSGVLAWMIREWRRRPALGPG